MDTTFIVKNLQDQRVILEQESTKHRLELSSLETEKNAKASYIKDKFQREIAELDSVYEETMTMVRTNMRQVSADISRIDRAISALVPHTSPKPSVTQQTAKNKITPEMVQDAVVLHLFQNKNGVNIDTIADMLEQKGYLDPAKNRQASMAGIVGSMVRSGLVDKKNSTYILADEQDAMQRVRLRKFVISTLRNGTMTVEQIENAVVQHGLLSNSEKKRRIRGLMLGLSNSNYVIREVVNDKEVFRINDV